MKQMTEDILYPQRVITHGQLQNILNSHAISFQIIAICLTNSIYWLSDGFTEVQKWTGEWLGQVIDWYITDI